VSLFQANEQKTVDPRRTENRPFLRKTQLDESCIDVEDTPASRRLATPDEVMGLEGHPAEKLDAVRSNRNNLQPQNGRTASAHRHAIQLRFRISDSFIPFRGQGFVLEAPPF
jgi:hypothetical protein